MTEPQDEAAHGGDDQFDPQRLRTLLSMRRSHDDKMIAGVCAGAARHLNIDPVIFRVLLATLTFFGLAGLILYAAAWLLIAEDGASESVAGRTFNLGEKEEQFRTVGLIVAAIIAIVSASSLIGGDAFDTPFPYVGLVALFLLWWFVIRPYQRDHRTGVPPPPDQGGSEHGAVPPSTAAPVRTGLPPPPATAGATATAPPAPHPPARPRNPRHDRGVLTALTFFAAMIAVGALWVYFLLSDTTHLPLFLSFALALAVIGIGMLVGSLVGNGRPLIPLAIVTALALSVSTALPTATVGQRTPAPRSAGQVDSEYRLGIGDLRVDLSDVTDLAALDGRTITLEEGVGSLEVIVPRGLDVDVDARTRAGRIVLFGQERNGDYPHVRYTDPVDDGPDVALVIEQSLGQIEVTRR